MRLKLKSLASAIAPLGFALLAFGPAASTAQAEPFGRHGSFQGRHGSFQGRHGSFQGRHGSFHGREAFEHRSFAPNRHREFDRPFHGFVPRAYLSGPRPYRLVRVFVYDPFPRWVYRRVYSTPYAGGYCPY